MIARSALALALSAVPALAAPPVCPLPFASFVPLAGPAGVGLAVRDEDAGSRWTLARGGERIAFGTVSQSGSGFTALVEEDAAGEPITVRAVLLDASLRDLNVPQAFEEPGRRPPAFLLLVGLQEALADRDRAAGRVRPLAPDGIWRISACAEPGDGR